MCISACLNVCICTTSIHGSTESEENPLELTESCKPQVAAGNRTRFLFMNTICFQSLSHRYSLNNFYLA